MFQKKRFKIKIAEPTLYLLLCVIYTFYMTPEIRDHLTANGHLTKRRIIVNNFLGGLAWGLGSVIGATIIVALLFWILSWIKWVPVVGEVATEVSNTIRTPKAPNTPNYPNQ